MKVYPLLMQLMTDFVKLLQKHFKDNLVSVVLYGSAARGQLSPSSDVDVCVVMNALPKSRYKRVKIIFPLLKEMRDKDSYIELYNSGYYPEISPLLFTKNEIRDTKPIFLDMIDDGIILLDDGTFGKKLEEIKERMKALGSKKIYLDDGSWYWNLKPDIKLGEVFTL
ncbi:nucleotidyltransferase domain-containing protein [candidate division KSB1 bacterium]|nr:nucleotidyltransferase domain-containing protein [candidate division KSB1 bacterium]